LVEGGRRWKAEGGGGGGKEEDEWEIGIGVKEGRKERNWAGKRTEGGNEKTGFLPSLSHIGLALLLLLGHNLCLGGKKEKSKNSIQTL
jgi:hypothetical protein